MTDADSAARTEPSREAADADTHRSRARFVAVAFAVVVFVVSIVPVPSDPSDGDRGAVGSLTGALPVDVGVTAPFHFVGYAALAALLVRAMTADRDGPALAAAATGAVAATAFGFGIEAVQAPIPWRSFSWVDAAVNAAGAVLGAGGYVIGRRRRSRRGGS